MSGKIDALEWNSAATEAVAKISKIVLAAWNAEKDEGQLKSKLDEVKKMALAAGIAYWQHLAPELVGVHPDNRGGTGASGQRMHALGANIVDAGFSIEETYGAVAFEDMPSRIGAKFTVELQNKSELLPKQDGDRIRHIACAGTHTNQLFNAILQGIATDEQLLSVNGHMSKAKILERCPSLAEPLEQGLRFFVFRWELWHDIPKLPWLVEAGANKPGVAQRKPSIFQSLMCMQQDVSEEMRRTGTNKIDKADVMRHASKDSEHVKHFPAMLDWIRLYGGGKEAFWTKELVTFANECCREPFIDGKLFAAIAGWKVNSKNLCEHASVALLKLAAKNPLLKVSAPEATKIGNLEVLPLIDRVLQEGRELRIEKQGGYNSSGSIRGPLKSYIRPYKDV